MKNMKKYLFQVVQLFTFPDRAVHLVPLSEGKTLAEFVIGNIDEEGYLRRTPEALADDVCFSG